MKTYFGTLVLSLSTASCARMKPISIPEAENASDQKAARFEPATMFVCISLGGGSDNSVRLYELDVEAF